MDRKKAVIWGAGNYGKRAYTKLITDYNLNIIAYIDSNPAVTGGHLYGVPVVEPTHIEKLSFEKIFIALADYEQIMLIKGQLQELNVSEDKIVELVTDPNYFDVLEENRSRWLRNCALYLKESGIRGNVAECGVFRGEFAKYINKYFPDRILYLFDTFEGFHESDLQEEYIKNKQFKSSMFDSNEIFKNTSIDFVLKKMTYPDNVVIKKGCFPDSAQGIDDIFCFVNLDMDLYLPILNGLRFFWDKMQPGGYILVHDYFRNDLSGVKKAIEDFENERGIVIVKAPIGDFCSILLIKG